MHHACRRRIFGKTQHELTFLSACFRATFVFDLNDFVDAAAWNAKHKLEKRKLLLAALQFQELTGEIYSGRFESSNFLVIVIAQLKKDHWTILLHLALPLFIGLDLDALNWSLERE